MAKGRHTITCESLGSAVWPHRGGLAKTKMFQTQKNDPSAGVGVGVVLVGVRVGRGGGGEGVMGERGGWGGLGGRGG